MFSYKGNHEHVRSVADDWNGGRDFSPRDHAVKRGRLPKSSEVLKGNHFAFNSRNKWNLANELYNSNQAANGRDYFGGATHFGDCRPNEASWQRKCESNRTLTRFG
jgi:hypothetical protein